MKPEAFIENAINQGVNEGLESLSKPQMFVFLISEAEVLCDMEDIDSFLSQYGSSGTELAAEAFLSVGAVGIAEGLTRIAAQMPEIDEVLWSHVNNLITDRVGYNYEAIERMVAA